MNNNLKITCKKEILLKMNNLNKLEQKLLFLVLSQIDPIKDVSNKTKLIKITKQFIKEKLNINHSYFYKELSDLTIGLNTKFIYNKKRNGNEEGYFHGTRIATAESKLYDTNIEFEITPKMIAYFTELTPPFVSIDINNILKLDSKYSIGIYTLLKSDLYKQNKYNHDLLFEVEYFNKLFNLNYDYKNLKRFVLKIAIEEINKNTDITIDFKEIKIGRKVNQISFFILNKSLTELKQLGIKSEENSPIGSLTESLAYRGKISDGHHLIFDKLLLNGITPKKAFDLIESDEINNDTIIPNIDYSNHLIANGYKVKSKSGFILESIRCNYYGSERAGKNRLKENKVNLIEKERQEILDDIEKLKENKRKTEDWWNSLSQEQKNEYIEKYKTGISIKDTEYLIKIRIFSDYLSGKI